MTATPSPDTSHRWTADHLLLATMLAMIWLFVSVLPLPPNDLWWHMAAGRIMVHEGAWITNNRWAYTLPADTPYVYQSWLSEIVLYGVWRVAGTPGLHLLRTCCIVASYALVGWAAWRATGGNGKAVTAALLLAVLAGWDNWTLRPQTLALVPGAALIAILSEYLAGRLCRRWLVALPLLVLLWGNLHGSFILGLALVALAWVALVVTALRQPTTAARSRLRDMSLCGAACLLAACVHPLGFGTFGYVSSMLSNTELQTRFVEWQPPHATPDLFNPGFWLYLALVLITALALMVRRASLAALLWFAALGWLATDAVRYIVWFALAAVPLLALLLAAPLRGKPTPVPQWLALGHALMLVALVIGTLPWFEPLRLFVPGGRWSAVATSGQYSTLLARQTPVAATEWLAANPRAGRFWTDMSYTSYTIWRLPDKQVFADLRVELFPRSIWDEYFAINAGNQASLATLDRWGITHLMLDRSANSALDHLLARTPGWCERYVDAASVVYGRCESDSDLVGYVQ
jgi:hypothetical protein